MTDNPASSSLTGDLLARDQLAQVQADEAAARKAAADADTSALTLTQAKWKALVPDFTTVAANSVDDKSTGVAFSGLVAYSALHHAAEIIVGRIEPPLRASAEDKAASILVTSEDDLLTSDLLASTVRDSMAQLSTFAGQVLDEQAPAPPEKPADQHKDQSAEVSASGNHIEMVTTVAKAIAAGGAVTVAGLGPLGLGAAAASMIPSIISLFQTATTVRDHTEDITDLATTAAVTAALTQKLGAHVTAVHQDFRLAPRSSLTKDSYRHLMTQRVALIFKQERMQKAKNEADLKAAEAQRKLDAAAKANPEEAADPAVVALAADAAKASADAAAALTVIAAVISSIDAFTAAVNATASGTRSPLATAILSDQLRPDSSEYIRYILLVKGLGSQSENYTKNRRVGFDSFATLADASVVFMLYDLTARTIISSGIANGISSVHGRLGEPPAGLIGPNAATAIDDQHAEATPEELAEQPSRPRGQRRFRIF